MLEEQNMESELSGTHRKVYDRLFQHPLPHNLEWRELQSMLSALPSSTAIEEKDGKLKVTRNGHTIVLQHPRGKDLADESELMLIRHFLEQSSQPAPHPAVAGTHLLVVIDHREARIYAAEVHGTVPMRITPYDPYGFGRSLRYVQDDSDGQRKPELKSFYEAVAKTLQGAQQILVFGTGTGASSAMKQLVMDLTKHHHDVAGRIIGSEVINEHHLTENQLLAMARGRFNQAS
jgi:hypothetical protein